MRSLSVGSAKALVIASGIAEDTAGFAPEAAGFSAAVDVQMTVMWDQVGFYGAYPLPSASLMYCW